MFRAKDLAGWWGADHYPRPGGARAATPTAWQAGLKPVRMLEIGFPAVDKGTNAPNVFVDPKSSESAFPFYSNGTRDDLLQRRALTASLSYWQAQPFIEQVLVWAWDGRPWPDFPAREEVWSDGPNWQFGHWLNGRTSLVELSDLVRDLGDEAGLALDVSGLDGVIDGYAVDGIAALASALAPLSSAFDFHVREAEHGLVAENSVYVPEMEINGSRLVDGQRVETHALTPLKPSGVALSYISGDFSYQPAVIEHRAPNANLAGLSRIRLPLVLTEGRARLLAKFFYQQALSNQVIRLGLAPSDAFELEVADPVSFDARDWRVEQIEDTLLVRNLVLRAQSHAPRRAIAVTIPDLGDPATLPADIEFEIIAIPNLLAPDATGPTLAVTGDPWLSPIEVKVGATLQSLQSKAILRAPAQMGQITTDLAIGVSGEWDHSQEFDVHIPDGGLVSADAGALLDGANRMAVANADGWEVIGWTTATLIGTDQWRLSGLLRGMLQTEALAIEAGAKAVIINDRLRTISLPPHQGGVPLLWQIGTRAPITYTYSP